MITQTQIEKAASTLSKQFSGYGHFKISIELDGEELSTVTTNTTAIDAAFDYDYDDVDNSERIYESRAQAQDALVCEILRKNDIEH
jgi:hypothetical protein